MYEIISETFFVKSYSLWLSLWETLNIRLSTNELRDCWRSHNNIHFYITIVQRFLRRNIPKDLLYNSDYLSTVDDTFNSRRNLCIILFGGHYKNFINLRSFWWSFWETFAWVCKMICNRGELGEYWRTYN